MTVKQMTFGFPNEDQRNICYSILSKHIQQVTTERLVLLENLKIFNPSGKYNLEFGTNYFKFFAAKEIHREAKDVVRLYLLEKEQKDNDHSCFIVIQLMQSKKVNDQDMLVIEVGEKRESRDVLMPDDQAEAERLQKCLQVDGFGEFLLSNEENEPYGPNSLIEKSRNIEKQNAVRLRAVPQYMAVFKFLQYVCKDAQVFISDYVQHKMFNQEFV